MAKKDKVPRKVIKVAAATVVVTFTSLMLAYRMLF